MRTLELLFVLCNTESQKRYRHIAAITIEQEFSIEFYLGIWEGEVLQEVPFDPAIPDVTYTPCATKSEAISKAKNEHTLCLSSGWKNYK